jgi:hypothetical protein
MTTKTNTRPPDLFTPPKELDGMVRVPDRSTSIDAATAVRKVLSDLHLAILEAFRQKGPMNDGELELLEGFEKYAYSTVRKRRTELVEMGKLVDSGLRRPGPGRSTNMIVWELAP